MIEETLRDIKAILHERVASPLYRLFILSWLVINWKIPYVTFFVNNDSMPSGMNKVEYISTHLLNWQHGLAYPLLSTAAFIWVFPWAANYVYKKDMQYKQTRIEHKQEIEKKRLLTVEESVALRAKIAQLQEEFEKSISEKEKEINTLNATVKQQAEEITSLKSAVAKADSSHSITDGFLQKSKAQETTSSENSNDPIGSTVERILTTPILKDNFCNIWNMVEKGTPSHLLNIDNVIMFWRSKGLLGVDEQEDRYFFTEDGKDVCSRIMSDARFEIAADPIDDF